MDLTLREETYVEEKHDWLGSGHGTDSTDPLTLDGALLGAIFADGIVRSGVVLGKITATGRYTRYADAGADGEETAEYLLFTTQRLRQYQDAAGSFKNVPAAGLWHGQVVEAKLPAGHGLTAAAKVDLKHVRFV